MDDNEFKVGTKVLICQGDPAAFCRRTGICSDNVRLSALPYLTIRQISYNDATFRIEEDDGFFIYETCWVDSLYQENDLFEVASDEEILNLLLE